MGYIDGKWAPLIMITVINTINGMVNALIKKVLDGGIDHMGVVAQGMCTVGISWCIKQRGPVFTSAFSPVTLMSATVFDFLILHRMIYLGSVIGSVVVVIGLYIFLWSKSKQIVECKIVKLPTSTVKEEKDEEDHTNVNKIGRHLVIPMTP
ncbi:hypothetical protein F2Q68_00002482 [Brassica cretica]|uniref:WAT1-related protein n=1 Tax=Brassica cretica TaxID=69181 RepID=A0A8S9JE31_BRACR|nr:hypothetical protein F2Q68_00002482 [Brassica cretica]